MTAAREALGGPTVALADALLATAAAADAARHATPRGAQTAEAAAELAGALPALRDAALAADAAARPLLAPDGAPGGAAGGASGRIGRAAGVVTGAAAAGLRAAEDGAAQAASLERLSGFDEQLAAAVSAWEQPGSQSVLRAALGELADDLDALAAQAAAEPAVPEGCPALRDARVRRATLVAERTRELAAAANSAGGERFDAERIAFSADPYGEDPLAGDAADRDCWGEGSVLAQAAAGIRGEVETLESLLQPERGSDPP